MFNGSIYPSQVGHSLKYDLDDDHVAATVHEELERAHDSRDSSGKGPE